MQPPSPAAPLPPAPPDVRVIDPHDPSTLVGAGSGVVAITPARAAPRTAQELTALREQRKWLSDQLTSAQGRRRDVARALERADNPANRAGLEQRLQVLDRRILQLETDIAETGRLLTTAPAALVAAAQAPRFEPPNFDRGPSASVIAIVFIASVLLPLAVALAKILVRRARPAAPDPILRETSARLARLEQAVDAIAVEVERVSEGQRFVTRLLTEQRPDPQLAAAGDTVDSPGGRDPHPNG